NRGSLRAHFHVPPLHLFRALRPARFVGRKFDDPEDAAAAMLRRSLLDHAVGHRVVVAAVRGRRAIGNPETGAHRRARRRIRRHQLIRDNHRAPLRVVTGDNATHLPGHDWFSLTGVIDSHSARESAYLTPAGRGRPPEVSIRWLMNSTT